MLGAYSIAAVAFCIVTACNFFDAVIGCDMDAFGSTSVYTGMISAIVLCGVGLVIQAVYSQNYQLLCVFPIKASSVPRQMVLLLDLIHLLCAAADAGMLLLCGYGNLVPLKLSLALVLYMVAHITLWLNVNPGMSRTDIRNGRKGMIVGITLLYILVISAVLTCYILAGGEYEGTSVQTVGIIATVAAAVLAVPVRILTYRGVRSKVRLIKVYKGAGKKSREVSYV